MGYLVRGEFEFSVPDSTGVTCEQDAMDLVREAVVDALPDLGARALLREESLAVGVERLLREESLAVEVERLRREVSHLRSGGHHLAALCPCDLNPSTTDGPQQECPVHGDGVTFVDELTRLRGVERRARIIFDTLAAPAAALSSYDYGRHLAASEILGGGV